MTAFEVTPYPDVFSPLYFLSRTYKELLVSLWLFLDSEVGAVTTPTNNNNIKIKKRYAKSFEKTNILCDLLVIWLANVDLKCVTI